MIYMSAFFGILLIVAALTAFGTALLAWITLKYYWGERGTPPLTGEGRRRAKEEELRLRAKQIANSKRNPIATRKASFWDNSKVYR
jgi:lipoprotein-anchoring transpeptidase ErfK/SrfK